MKENIADTVEYLREAFPRTPSPISEWGSCKSVEDFVERFGGDFFTEFWPHMYENSSVTSFMFPLVMEYFLTVYPRDSDSNAADYFIGTLDPVVQKEVQLDLAVEQFFAGFSEKQRRGVCKWLDQMGKRSLLVNLEGAKTFWCRNLYD